MALPASDSFTDDNGTQLSAHDASWDEYNAMDINSNAACSDFNGDETAASWEGDAFNNDQYSEATVDDSGGAGSYIGIGTREDGADTYYGWYNANADQYLFKMVSGVWTELGNDNGTWSATDVLRLESEGTTHTPTLNGGAPDTPGAQTDGAIAAGYAGLCGYGDYVDTNRLGDWEGGNLAAPSAGKSMTLWGRTW